MRNIPPLRQQKTRQLYWLKGQVANQYFYIRSGGPRFFYNEDEVQKTSWEMFQDNFFTEISSLAPKIPTLFNVEAIEESAEVKKSCNADDFVTKPFDIDNLVKRVSAQMNMRRL